MTALQGPDAVVVSGAVNEENRRAAGRRASAAGVAIRGKAVCHRQRSGGGFLGGVEAAVQVFDQIGSGFQPGGQANRTFRDAGRQQGVR